MAWTLDSGYESGSEMSDWGQDSFDEEFYFNERLLYSELLERCNVGPVIFCLLSYDIDGLGVGPNVIHVQGPKQDGKVMSCRLDDAVATLSGR